MMGKNETFILFSAANGVGKTAGGANARARHQAVPCQQARLPRVEAIDPHPRNPDAVLWVAVDAKGRKFVVNGSRWRNLGGEALRAGPRLRARHQGPLDRRQNGRRRAELREGR
jgi:hypothetical protein